MEQSLFTIFITGLLTGGLTCLAVQGGLLAATIAQQEKQADELGKKGKLFAVLSFLLAKLVAYTALGFLLGWLGSFFQLSIGSRAVLQVAVGIFMIGTAFSILNVHPIFRYFIIQPPRFLTRFIRSESKSSSIFAPSLLGFLTVFIPCGTTQAMMALSIASGSPILGATILFVFILGTSPVFFTLGYLATRLGNAFQQKFLKLAAVGILFLAIFNIDGAVSLTGTPFTLRAGWSNVSCFFTLCNYNSEVSAAPDASDNPTVMLSDYGYSPNVITVNRGKTVELNIVNKNARGCIQAFTIPSLNVLKIVSLGKSEKIRFTAPSLPQQIAFMCSMGMYRGVINVI